MLYGPFSSVSDVYDNLMGECSTYILEWTAKNFQIYLTVEICCIAFFKSLLNLYTQIFTKRLWIYHRPKKVDVFIIFGMTSVLQRESDSLNLILVNFSTIHVEYFPSFSNHFRFMDFRKLQISLKRGICLNRRAGKFWETGWISELPR